jgi:hypothetical protein
MKHLFFISLVLFALQADAQSVQYDTCQYNRQFEGEWWHISGSDTIKIYLRYSKNHDVMPDGTELIQDCLFGWHEYKRGSTVIESTYANRFMTLPYEDTLSNATTAIRIGMNPTGNCSTGSKMAKGSIVDYSQAKEIKSVKVTLDATGTIMTWKQSHREGYGFFTGAYGMTLPKEFVLTKQ